MGGLLQTIIARETRVRFFIALALLSVIAFMFWTSSRYPSLGDKALMAGSIQLEDPLSFEALYTIEPQFPVWKKILLTTINWLDTNRKGMIFGVLMGSVFLTLFRYVRRVNFQNGFLNSVLGLFMGAPMGVCVNCAAPIAKGLYSGGARAETVLSAMVSSPTLNIVVLTMLFSILPFYMGVTKVGLSLLVILVAIPLICRFLPANERQIPAEERRSCPLPQSPKEPAQEGLIGAVRGFSFDFASDLWYIIRLTVPLMVLAGFLGSVVATLIPIEVLNDLRFGLIGLVLVALIGTFLPVPIAFDIVICAALLAGGLHVGYVMTLLFTLGIVSVYSYFIVAQAVSIRAASYLAGVVALLGILAGAAVHNWHAWQTKRALDFLTQEMANVSVSENASPLPAPALTSVASVAPVALDTEDTTIKIERLPFGERSPEGALPFSGMEAHKIGIDQPIEFSFKDMWPPFWEGRSISSGDIDGDGDIDVVIASTRVGLHIYDNDGKGEFTPRSGPLAKVKELPVFNAALIDFDNDGWLDIFLATYQKGNFILWNEGGTFSGDSLTPVLNRDDAMLSLALAFADVDRDGDLDVALGNWAAGWYRRIPGEESRNRIVFNDAARITGQEYLDLPGLPGETLSILFSDINSDGATDLLVGNDFELPDVFYFGDGAGGFNRIRRSDGIIPHTTNMTMAIKSHDLDNDLQPEIYLAQIAGRSSGISERLKMQPIELYCDGVERRTDREICARNMAIKTWYKSGNNFDPTYAEKCLELESDYQAECKAMLVKDLAIQGEDPSICELIPLAQEEAKAYCLIHFKPAIPPTQADMLEYPLQIKQRNVLLVPQQNGQYEDQSIARKLEVGGWSWDTKIADFDNDGWSDVLIVNGTWVPNEFTPSNMFFLNDGSGTFSERAIEFGFEDYLITAAATHFDMDHDGDLDVVTVPVNGPIQAYINNSQDNHAISFKITDKIGNRFGVGARIVIRFGKNGEYQQVREIQAGGGFQSFDAPVAHFGLGTEEQIDSAIIFWPDGSSSSINEVLMAGATYHITRTKLID